MARRIAGLFLILRALSPVLIILVIGLTAFIVLGDVRAAVDPSLQTIRGEITEIRTTVEEVEDDIAAVNEDITALVGDLQGFSIPNLIPDIPANLSFPSLDIPNVNIPRPTASVQFSNVNVAGVNIRYPSGLSIGSTNFNLNLPNIPAFSVPLPGLSQIDDQLRSALSGVTGVFDTFDDAFTSIGDLNGTLQRVPDHVTTISSETQVLADGFMRVFARWQQTLLIVFLVLLALTVIYLGVPVLDDLSRGWNMLRGRA